MIIFYLFTSTHYPFDTSNSFPEEQVVQIVFVLAQASQFSGTQASHSLFASSFLSPFPQFLISIFYN